MVRREGGLQRERHEEGNRLDFGRYAEEYETFFEDTENLVLRVY